MKAVDGEGNYCIGNRKRTLRGRLKVSNVNRWSNTYVIVIVVQELWKKMSRLWRTGETSYNHGEKLTMRVG